MYVRVKGTVTSSRERRTNLMISLNLYIIWLYLAAKTQPIFTMLSSEMPRLQLISYYRFYGSPGVGCLSSMCLHCWFVCFHLPFWGLLATSSHLTSFYFCLLLSPLQPRLLLYFFFCWVCPSFYISLCLVYIIHFRYIIHQWNCFL